jgi:hypothetical protein
LVKFLEKEMSHSEIVKDRIANNSRLGKFKNGVEYVVCAGPDLEGLVHEELHRLHPTIPVTCVVALRLGGPTDQISHWLRSWDPKVDLSTLTGGKCGGDPAELHCRRETNLELDY